MKEDGKRAVVSVDLDYLYYNDALSSENYGSKALFTWPSKITTPPPDQDFVYLQRVWDAQGRVNKAEHKWRRTTVTGIAPAFETFIGENIEAWKTLLSLNIFVLTEVPNEDGIPAEDDGGAARIRFKDLDTLEQDYSEWKQRKTRESKKNATGRIPLVVGPSDSQVRGIMFIRVRKLSIDSVYQGGEPIMYAESEETPRVSPLISPIHHPFHIRDLDLISPDYLLNSADQLKKYTTDERDYETAYKKTQQRYEHSLPGSADISLPEYLTNNPRLYPAGSPDRILPDPAKEITALRDGGGGGGGGSGGEGRYDRTPPLKLPGFAMLMETIPESSEDYWLTLFGYVFAWLGKDYSKADQWNALSVGDKICVITAVIATPSNRGHSYKLDQRRTQRRGATQARNSEATVEVNEQMGGVAVEDCEDDGIEGWKAFYSFRYAKFSHPVLVDAQRLTGRCVYAILMSTVNGAKVGGEDKSVGAHIVGAVFPLVRVQEMLGVRALAGGAPDITETDRRIVTVLGEGTGIVPPFNYQGLSDVYDRVTEGAVDALGRGDEEQSESDPTRALNPVLMHQWYKGGKSSGSGRAVFGWTQGYESREQALRKKMISHDFYNSAIGALFRDEALGPDPYTALFLRGSDHDEVGIPMVDLLRPVPMDGEEDVAILQPVVKSIDRDLLRGVATLTPHAFPHPPFVLGDQIETMPAPLADFIGKIDKDTRGRPMYDRCKDYQSSDTGELISVIPVPRGADAAVVPYWITDWTAQSEKAMERHVTPALLGNEYVICVELTKEPLGMGRHAWRLMVLVSMKGKNV